MHVCPSGKSKTLGVQRQDDTPVHGKTGLSTRHFGLIHDSAREKQATDANRVLLRTRQTFHSTMGECVSARSGKRIHSILPRISARVQISSGNTQEQFGSNAMGVEEKLPGRGYCPEASLPRRRAQQLIRSQQNCVYTNQTWRPAIGHYYPG